MKSYSVGARVSQPQYGTGTITLANEYHTVIDFDDHGSRTFSTRLVQLGRCDTEAPVRAKPVRRRKAAPALAKS
ncbi:MAG: hypothetical protein ACRD26_21560 [Vicinamibacterales bacterium]